MVEQEVKLIVTADIRPAQAQLELLKKQIKSQVGQVSMPTTAHPQAISQSMQNRAALKSLDDQMKYYDKMTSSQFKSLDQQNRFFKERDNAALDALSQQEAHYQKMGAEVLKTKVSFQSVGAASKATNNNLKTALGNVAFLGGKIPMILRRVFEPGIVAGRAAGGVVEAGGGGMVAGMGAAVTAGIEAAGPVAVAIAILLAVGEIIKTGFSGTIKVLGIIFKVLGMILKPIDLLVMTMLMPLITILMPLIKFMNMIFAPLRRWISQQLVASMKSGTTGMAALAGAGIGMAIGGPLGAILGLILGPILMPLFADLAAAIITGLETQIAFLATLLAVSFLDALKAQKEILKGILTLPFKLASFIFSLLATIFGAMAGLPVVGDMFKGLSESLTGLAKTSDDFSSSISKVVDDAFSGIIKSAEDMATATAKWYLDISGTFIRTLDNININLGNAGRTWVGVLDFVIGSLDTGISKLIETGRKVQDFVRSFELQVQATTGAAYAAQPVERQFVAMGAAGEAPSGMADILTRIVAGIPVAPSYIMDLFRSMGGASINLGALDPRLVQAFKDAGAIAQEGGIVGKEGMAYIHKGETITPAGRNGGQITNNVTVNATVSSDVDIKDLAEQISRYLHIDMSRRTSYGTRIV